MASDLQFPRPRRSIRAKLALLIAASVGAAVFIAFAVSSVREIGRFGEAKRAELTATAEILATSVADPVANGDRVAARQALNAIGRIPQVRYAEIRDASDRTFAEAGTGVALALAEEPPDGVPISVWGMLSQGSFFATAEIVKGGRPVGRIRLLVDTSELADRLKQALFAALLSAAAATAIGLLVASRLQRSITRPLGELAETMNRVRVTSDFRQRAERRTDDETGQLVDAFNDMLHQVERRDDALEQHRAGLERTVEERTRDLATARDAAESANRAKSDFLATMSHEIRTPMNGMLVMAELLAGTALPVRQQRYAETIVRSGQTLLTIINDILDLSKIEAGKLELEQGRVSIATIVDDVLALFSERASSKSLDLAAQIAGDVPAVIEADPVRLSQVLSNLVNNALKFTERGHVSIVVAREENAGAEHARLLFAVEDTGIGIPADKVGRIFEAFSQADQTTTRRFGGTGLGLSICQRLVAAWNGRIWAESEAGRGSRFAFTLEAPVLEPAAEESTRAGRIAAIATEGIATQRVITETLAERSYAVKLLSPDSPATDAHVIFADPEWIEARPARSGQTDRPVVIAVAGVGNSKVDRLLAAGLAEGVLGRPVCSTRVREILAAIDAGNLFSLLEGRRHEPASDLPLLPPLTVLVADDSPVNREVVTEALARLSARTTTVENGVEAVAALKAAAYDIVLMDCSMPEMDGFAATRALRAWEAERGAQRTPVVALTAHVAGSAADSWRDAGMDDYLTKPFTIRSLAECLMRWQPAGPQAVVTNAADRSAMSVPAERQEYEEDAPLDPSVLQSLRAIAGGNSAVLRKVFGLFEAHAPSRIAALQDAIAASDCDRIATEAHALKSPSLNIGGLRLGALCADMETRGRAADETIMLDGTLGAVEAELARVLAAIAQELEPDSFLQEARKSQAT